MKPQISIYQGQSLAPPDQRGLTAGYAIWILIGEDWYRVESTSSMFKVKAALEKVGLRKWPFTEESPTA